MVFFRQKAVGFVSVVGGIGFSGEPEIGDIPSIHPFNDAAGIVAGAQGDCADAFDFFPGEVGDVDVEEGLRRDGFPGPAFDQMAGEVGGTAKQGPFLVANFYCGAHGDGGNAIEGAFAGGCHGSRVIDVQSQISALVDAGDDEVRSAILLFEKVKKGQNDAIGGMSGASVTIFSNLNQPQGVVQGQAVPRGGAFSEGSHYQSFNVGNFFNGIHQGVDTGGMDAIVVGDEDQHIRVEFTGSGGICQLQN